MVEPRDIEFEVEGGDRLRGWLFTPTTALKRYPAISMAHGYAGVKEHGLKRFAQAFAAAGFVVLVIAISGRATGLSATISTHGARLLIGDVRSHSWNPGRMLTPTASASGAPVTPAGTSWFSAPRIVVSARSSPKCRRSAATSKACAVWRQTRYIRCTGTTVRRG
jgi:dienelactone hydrolase